MVEIKVLPDGDEWTWKLRRKGGEWIARKETSVKRKFQAQKSAERASIMLEAEGVEVDLHLGYVNRCWSS